MENKDLATMIAEEVSKAVAPLYKQLEQIKSRTSGIENEAPFEKGYFRSHYEKTGRIKKD